MPEKYAEIEARIEAACERLSELDKPNIAAMAREFQVPDSRLCALWNGVQPKTQRPAANKRLSDEEELAVCLYLKRLDSIGTSARLPMLTGCANAILRWRKCTSPDSPPPTVGPNWTIRFLERYPEFHIRKQKSLDANRKEAHHPDDLFKYDGDL